MTAAPFAADDRRILVAHVVHRFDVGGLENGVVNLINHLPPARYAHAVVALTEVTDFKRRIVRDDVTFHSMGKPPGHGMAIYRDLLRLFRTLGPTIVHTRNIGASEAHLPARLAGVPVRIHGEHGWEVQDVAGGKRTHHWQRRLLRPLIHRHVALSGEIRRYLETRVGVDPTDIAQICNGVDVERFSPRIGERSGPVAERFPDDVFVVGTVGRLSPVKHQRLLVDAFALAADRLPLDVAGKLRLVVAGDGPDRQSLERQVAGSGLADRVWLAGARDDVSALMANFDVFVLPSLAEGISNTILEAMACGLPVIATDVGGNGELVDATTSGTLVRSDDADAMANVICGYALDPARIEREGRAARARAIARFSIDTMVARYDELYEGLVSRGHVARPRDAVGQTRTQSNPQSAPQSAVESNTQRA
jgi:sugar transferase (PEP-CTERM/EpsH1 system associated)